MLPNSEDSQGIFQPIIGAWYKSLENPQISQEHVLSKLTRLYAKTLYGKTYHAAEVSTITDFRAKFPVLTYKTLNPYLSEVEKGNDQALLPEPLLCWVMTRGSTGPAKVLPATKTHLEQIFTCGARALINHVLRTKDYDLLDGRILNLNFPSNVHTIVSNGRTMTYGYSSGTYAKLNPALDKVSLTPRQEEIDKLGPGMSRRDWETRFELAYQQAKDEKVTATMGVTPVILSFARYMKKKHGKKPKDLWTLRGLFCTSVRKIQFKYAPILKKYYGNVPAIEIYSATEGVFAQQLDQLPYVTPNYDTYLLEVQTGKETKMLHELGRGEWGRLIVSTCMFPRYAIGDLIESAGNDYYRVIGREKRLTLLEHKLYKTFFGWLV
jgi:phenylacetate-coenzyme A ligase PaaK-like adenylate-forming protein